MKKSLLFTNIFLGSIIITAIIAICVRLMVGPPENKLNNELQEVSMTGLVREQIRKLTRCDSDSDCVCCDEVKGRYLYDSPDEICVNKNYLRENNLDCVKKESSDSFCRRQCKCENNSCVAPEKKITIITDKAEYKQGEQIKITVYNGLNVSVYSEYYKGNWYILKRQDGRLSEPFQKITSQCICEKYPDGNCPELKTRKPVEIKSLETEVLIWNQKIPIETENGCFNLIDASPGKYYAEFSYWLSETLTIDEKGGGITNTIFMIKKKSRPREADLAG